MRNILYIIRDDFRKLRLNSISLLIAIGLVCIPSCYAWFNIGGSWDPYGNTSQLPIGVVNKDKGYTNKYLPMDINMGDNVISSLYSNTQLKWEFSDEDTALENLANGNLYAVIVIPEDFSANIMSIINEKAENAKLIYVIDEKKNAIAPKITSKGADAIQHKVNKIFSQTILNGIFKVTANLIDLTKSENVTSLINKLSTSFGDASTGINGAVLQLQSLKELTASLQDLITQINELLPDDQASSIEQLQQNKDRINAKLGEAKKTIDELAKTLEKIGLTPQAAQTLRELSDIIGQVQQILNSTTNIGQDVASNMNNLRTTLGIFSELLTSLDGQLDRVSGDLKVVAGDMTNAKTALDALSSDATLEQVEKIIGENPSSFAQLVSAPFVLDRIAVNHVENNGAAMAGFYTSLSIWVGITLMMSVVKVGCSDKRRQRMNRKLEEKAAAAGRKFKPIKDWHLYFGRYGLFLVFAVLQALLISLGEIFFLGIGCLHPWLYIGCCLGLAAIFSFFIYTLVYCFGNIGKAIAVILLVLQISCTGGMFPPEMIAWPFNLAYPYLPLSYALQMLNMCVAGFPPGALSTWWILLFGELVPLSLILGLALRRFIKRGNEWFVAKVHESNLLI